MKKLSQEYIKERSESWKCRQQVSDKHLTTVTELFQDADDALFCNIFYNNARILHTYLPEWPELV